MEVDITLSLSEAEGADRLYLRDIDLVSGGDHFLCKQKAGIIFEIVPEGNV